jgi:stage V sporulation protein G
VEITRIRIFPFEQPGGQSKIRAYAEVDLDDALIIRGIRIIESKSGGLFIALPSAKTPRGDFRDLVIAKDKALAADMRDKIISAYKSFGSTTSDTLAEEIQ